MSSNNAVVVRKIAPDKFEVRYVGCIDNYGEPNVILDEKNQTTVDGPIYDGYVLDIFPTLEEAMKLASNQETEYGVTFECPYDEQELDVSIQHSIKSMNEHDKSEVIKCPYCGSTYMSERAVSTYHNHAPWGQCMDEIWECEDCGRYLQVIWKLTSVFGLDRTPDPKEL
jgi:hypothetical protein